MKIQAVVKPSLALQRRIQRGRIAVEKEVVPAGRGIGTTRLVLAALVVVSHSFPLGGFGPEAWAVVTHTDTLGGFAVCGFFLLSGWLVASSASRSTLPSYLQKRARRLLPGFWAALILVALVSTLLDPTRAREAVSYVQANFALVIHQPDIAAMTALLPHPGEINGSMWTLQWEALCYLGVLPLLRFRLGLPIAVGVLWGLTIATGSLEIKFAALFALGAMLRDRPPRPNHAVGVAAVLAILVSGQLGLYLLVGLPALVILIYWAAEHAPYRSPDSDPSYGLYIYAYPIQQGLAAAGLATLGLVSFMGVSLALALVAGFLSWRLVERPVARWQLRGRRRDLVPAIPQEAST